MVKGLATSGCCFLDLLLVFPSNYSLFVMNRYIRGIIYCIVDSIILCPYLIVSAHARTNLKPVPIDTLDVCHHLAPCTLSRSRVQVQDMLRIDPEAFQLIYDNYIVR